MSTRLFTALALLCLLLTTLISGPRPVVIHAVNRVVTSPADTGPGTLRQALLDAVAGDTIVFSPAAFPPGSPVTISIRSVLPTLNKDSLIIDASEAGVILDGSQAQAGTNGLIVEGSHCLIQGLRIQHFSSNGIYIAVGATDNTIGGDRSIGAGPTGQGNLIVYNGGSGVEIRGNSNLVQGNYIGVDPTGSWDWGNTYNGVAIWQGASYNFIGGSTNQQNCQTSNWINGLCNVISGNRHNGVWIAQAATQNNWVMGNYIGTRADGLGPLGNHLSGVAIQGGAQNNSIGDNLISGNLDNGVYISDSGTSFNRLYWNFIGTDWRGTGIIGQGTHGVVIANSASQNVIGYDTQTGHNNVIGGNTFDGVRIEGAGTFSNTVRGNIIGANVSGTAPLPNGMHGVELADSTHDNLIGGNRQAGLGNLLSGDQNHGLVITGGAHHNTILGNIVGPDVTGAHFLGNHPSGGIDISNGAHHNVIGGLAAGEGNVISGNPTDGIALFTNDGRPVTDTQLLGNLIGVALDGTSALPNHGWGVLVTEGVARTRIEGNTIAFNEGNGVLVAACERTTITANSIFSNSVPGIRNERNCPQNPTITGAVVDNMEIITGTAIPNGRVEVFSDADGQGQIYEGYSFADGAGHFSFAKAQGFSGPNVVATVTDAEGNTSGFSQPYLLAWTVLLYLNGDNDLQDALFETFDSLVAAGPFPRANVLALVDGYTDTTRSGTKLYDITQGQPITLSVPAVTLTGERNMGDKQTLMDFVNWGRSYAPARHTLLAIVDHGGGWAPTSTLVPGAMPQRNSDYLGGNSGLSWDTTSDHDYLDSRKIREALASITSNGAAPLDVVFYDVCLMGMLEVAYQIKDYASYFVSSQNIGWAPVGENGRYVQAIHGIGPTTDPRDMAALLVDAYAAANPPNNHPFTVSAVDLNAVEELALAVHHLGSDLSSGLGNPSQNALMYQAYADAQKLDYDANFIIDQQTESFVDLYDFAEQIVVHYGVQAPWLAAHAEDVKTKLNSAVVAERHQGGTPWMPLSRPWNLDRVHGISIFLPLGEDLELSIPITMTSPITPGLVITRNLHLREMYTCEQLEFTCEYWQGQNGWGRLIDNYYGVAAIPANTATGPLGGLLSPDVTPPQTVITLTGMLKVGQEVRIAWASDDDLTGVASAALWHRLPGGQWVDTGQSQPGPSGDMRFILQQTCENSFAVRAVDDAGNLESIESGSNTISVEVPSCLRFPMVMSRHTYPLVLYPAEPDLSVLK